MSRAFVKESDDGGDDLPDLLISPYPNFVTPEGLAAIEAELARLHKAADGAGEDRPARASIARDLRYWSARRASAQMVDSPISNQAVRFGSTVTIDRADARLVFRIVGEDEADPERGTLSYVAPLARALMGKAEGDTARVGEHAVEIVTIA